MCKIYLNKLPERKIKKSWLYLKNGHQKQKKNSRKANWKRKAAKSAQRSLSLAKSILRGKTTSFVYRLYVEEES